MEGFGRFELDGLQYVVGVDDDAFVIAREHGPDLSVLASGTLEAGPLGPTGLRTPQGDKLFLDDRFPTDPAAPPQPTSPMADFGPGEDPDY